MGKKPGTAPKIKERSDTTSTGCIFCFRNPKLRKNSLNYSSNNCRLDPANGFKSKQSFANQAFFKVNIREVLSEPVDKKRSHEEMEEGEYRDRPLGSDPNDFDMDSSEDSEDDQPKKNKKKGGKK